MRIVRKLWSYPLVRFLTYSIVAYNAASLIIIEIFNFNIDVFYWGGASILLFLSLLFSAILVWRRELFNNL